MMDKPLYIQYAEDVINDKVIACEYIKLACKQFLFNLKRDDIEFREKR